MCDPVTLAFVAVGATVAQGASGMQTARVNRKAAVRHQDFVIKTNEQLAKETRVLAFDAIQARSIEESKAASAAIQETTRRALAARGAATAAAGAAGLRGTTLGTLLGDFERQEARGRGAILTNLAFRKAQLEREGEGIVSNQRARLASNIPQHIPKVDYLGASLSIIGNAATIVGNVQSQQALLKASQTRVEGEQRVQRS